MNLIEPSFCFKISIFILFQGEDLKKGHTKKFIRHFKILTYVIIMRDTSFREVSIRIKTYEQKTEQIDLYYIIF